eukprot:gene1040-2035_t
MSDLGPLNIDYLDRYNHQSEGFRPIVLVLYFAFVVLLIYLLGHTANNYFSPSLAVICDKLKLPYNIAGVTFLAMGNGAPDVFSSVTSFTGNKDFLIGIGALLVKSWWINPNLNIDSIGLCTSNNIFLEDSNIQIRNESPFVHTDDTAYWYAPLLAPMNIQNTDVDVEEEIHTKRSEEDVHSYIDLKGISIASRKDNTDTSRSINNRHIINSSSTSSSNSSRSLLNQSNNSNNIESFTTPYKFITINDNDDIIHSSTDNIDEGLKTYNNQQIHHIIDDHYLTLPSDNPNDNDNTDNNDKNITCLSAIGTILHIPSSVLGLTIIAWGNSIGDFFANISLSKKDFTDMALSGCYAGPIFNLMIGLGILLKKKQESVENFLHTSHTNSMMSSESPSSSTSETPTTSSPSTVPSMMPSESPSSRTEDEIPRVDYISYFFGCLTDVVPCYEYSLGINTSVLIFLDNSCYVSDTDSIWLVSCTCWNNGYGGFTTVQQQHLSKTSSSLGPPSIQQKTHLLKNT